MKQRLHHPSRSPLFVQLARFIRLRWLAGFGVLVGAFIEWRWLATYGNASRMAVVGAVILIYNIPLWLILHRVIGGQKQKAALLGLAWAQLLLDLGCLTVLTLLTGGIDSPLRPFFLLHMVFASLLLPRLTAYGGASLAMLFLAAGLWITGQWPTERRDIAALLCWMATLLLTVWLANGITRDLRRKRHRLVRQNRRIREMSEKLTRQQQGMIQQEKMAAAGRMAAGIAHEIANPLASMDGLLQLMERRPEKLRPDAVATLREQVARISQIVRRMTTFAHPDDGRWAVGNLNEVVEKALGVIRFDPRFKHTKVERELAPGLPEVRMVPDALQQVVINLVINALDAMEGIPQPRLAIRSSASARWCSLEIADNGHGIHDEHLKHLFEPFFTTKPVDKGTGLGLSISYSLVRSHGGEIAVNSRVGEGTRFTIRIPLQQAQQARTQPTSASAPDAYG